MYMGFVVARLVSSCGSGVAAGQELVIQKKRGRGTIAQATLSAGHS